ncbi:synaptophysin-like [Actinia tenebrosa]|uniref:Synaptophysin-like n=1 Tax=Actinia tenebrosa TaxID=6105 RepID=A0A6P8IHP7_ACTTE|nr:synaptophysin-like [Actinia tenebrosa]
MPSFNKNPNINILKEPRGFIKIIEVAIAIFAFSTTVGYHGHFDFSISCNKTVAVHTGADFSYSFNEISYYFSDNIKLPVCKNVSSLDVRTLPLNYKSESEYFVFVGVTCFLYAIGATLYYMFVENQDHDAASTDIGICNFVIVDFVITVVYVIFWFTASIAWAAGLDGLKDATSSGKTSLQYPACRSYNCNPSTGSTYGALNVSVVLGFLNFLVWCFNIWFLFKETPWHSPRNPTNIPGNDPDAVTQETPPASSI